MKNLQILVLLCALAVMEGHMASGASFRPRIQKEQKHYGVGLSSLQCGMKAFSPSPTEQSKTHHLRMEKDKAIDFKLFSVVNGVTARAQGV